MATRHAADMKARRGLPDKHRAILRGALTVFARDVYTRASMDAIAAEAGVSTRTIYNHFGDKADLFHAVIQDSATQVADAQIAVIDRHLTKIIDLEAGLTEFARAWAAPMLQYIDHFAMVRQINAEAGHIPQAALDTWQETGPRRVHRELARRIQRLADQGLLRVTDPDRAAMHLVLLTATEVANRSYHGAIPLPETEITRIADAGVQAFLHGYLP
jgi:AcrR family transcriptional regulator